MIVATLFSDVAVIAIIPVSAVQVLNLAYVMPSVETTRMMTETVESIVGRQLLTWVTYRLQSLSTNRGYLLEPGVAN